MLADGELRRVGVVRRPLNLAWVALGVAVLIGAIVLLAGHGGYDGALGIVIAFAVLVGAAVAIQRVTNPRVAFGFNPDGVYDRTQGWIPWAQVRRIEVRRYRRLLGSQTVVWLAYQRPAGDSPADGEGWVAVRPGWGPKRTTELAARLEALWTQRPGTRLAAAGGLCAQLSRPVADAGDGCVQFFVL